MQLKLQTFQLDVKSTFLQEALEEQVYVEQPQVYIIECKEDKVYHFQKHYMPQTSTPSMELWNW